LTRESAIADHGSHFYNQIFNQKEDTLKVNVDGTYLFVEKPGNFKEQRKTYSGQKHRNLVKPMMLVLHDGYILEVVGGFFGKRWELRCKHYEIYRTSN